ncbi:hypothetical protein GCM10018955_59980 [Planomonospora venezuelensis]
MVSSLSGGTAPGPVRAGAGVRSGGRYGSAREPYRLLQGAGTVSVNVVEAARKAATLLSTSAGATTSFLLW